ncbi:MAG TPA: spermidine synthase [Thermoanaerobaculia bacterium]|jgi:spermidine synthase|nr:spermidine synthase [Thermoanaerobaculia bacterium]
MRAWQTVDRADTPEGPLELRRRGDAEDLQAPEAAEYVITIGGRVLMNGSRHKTEDAVAEAACRPLAGQLRLRGPRVLIGGLGMGFTLRAALDLLPRSARVLVAEIDPVIVRWCRGPLAPLTRNAIDDRRVTVEVADVAVVLARAARTPAERFDAVVLDLYEGPREAHGGKDHPLWGERALGTTRDALLPGGTLAVWSEDADAAFEKRLAVAGFRVERRRPGKGGPRHAVYVARRK